MVGAASEGFYHALHFQIEEEGGDGPDRLVQLDADDVQL